MTTDRFIDHPAGSGHMMRAEWHTPITQWRRCEGRAVVARAKAVWHLPDGDLDYIEIESDADSFAFNVLAKDAS